MTALLLKDVKSSAPLIGAVLVLYALASATAARMDEPLFWLSVALTTGLWALPVIVDWQVDADGFICSLPVERAAIVRARGVWMMAAAVAGVGLWAASGTLWRSVRSLDVRSPSGVPTWATFEGLIAFGAVTLVLAVVFLPCHCRFGIGKGSAVFGALILGIAAALAGLALLSGMAPSSERSVAGFANALPAALIQRTMTRLRGGLGVVGAVGLMGGAGTIAVWLSIRLAARFYEKREF